MKSNITLHAKYTGSRALIIGIDKYLHSSPLSYAVSDATAVRDLLIELFDFKKENVTFLINEQATREKIMKSYLRYTHPDVDKNERIFIFFAGHGDTKTGSRGEVGYLIPYDADESDLSTFIRWDDLTKNSELIAAKHILFIMDACYGGLAITRSYKPGSVRFLENMLTRNSRQVLTAGKADELVADSGGPIPNHSIFTGHLIEGLKGNAAYEKGIITASSVMAYVYKKVSGDHNSRQTPHYGFIEGDGDFIFKGTESFSEDRMNEEDEKKDKSTLITIPSAEIMEREIKPETKIEKVKRLLSSSNGSIELHDFLADEIRLFLASSTEDNFSLQGSFSKEELLNRITKYESIISDIAVMTACIAYWAKSEHRQILQKTLARITDRLNTTSGLVAWIKLQWYPIIFQIYSAGIAAVESKRYDSLNAIFCTSIHTDEYDNQSKSLSEVAADAIVEFTRNGLFKNLPGHENNYVPMSEYLFKQIQPLLDDVLFIGKNYESSFDEFEVMLGLSVCYHNHKKSANYFWGPIGRFGYKYHSPNSPFRRIIETAKLEKENWEPLKQGMFDGDYKTFILCAEKFGEIISQSRFL